MSGRNLGWWFEPRGGVLEYGDGRRPEPGVTHTVDVEPRLCEAGLHWSRSPLDALNYASSNVVWRVRGGGAVVHGDDKSAGTERTYLWGLDATDVLRHFARLCALDVIHLWEAPDVVSRYLRSGDETLRADARAAAGAAAGDAAWAAARAAAWAAARDAAGDAAGDAARDAARAAARDAAGDAARDAVRDAAWAAARAAARDAAGDAARDAAWAAARDTQTRGLTRMLMAEARRQGVTR